MITNRLPAGAAGAQPPAAAVARVAVAERGRALAVGAVARVAVAELVLAARATGARGVAPDLGELVAGRFGAPLDLAAAVRAWRAVGQPGRPLRAAEPWRDGPGPAASAGLSAGLAAGLGIGLRTAATAALGIGLRTAATAALGIGLLTAATAALGIGLRTAATAALGAATASRVPAARGTLAWRVAGRGTAGARRGNLLARRGHAQAEGGGGVRVFRFLDDRVLLELELVVEQVPDRILLDPLHHGVEQVVALA